ncbi:MAG: two-component system sensor histidine kinase CreC [Akkermansiaceae bacterium]|nr:two-component system sensor histidine kinase CreC [Akkermansiaceae bacterium]
MRLTRVTLLCLALIISFGFYRLIVYILEDIEAQTFQATEEMMVDISHVMAGMIEDGIQNGEIDQQSLRNTFKQAQSHKIEAQIYGHNKTNLGLNAYLTHASGKVVFDSDNGLRKGQDFSGYNDVILTLRGEYGARSTRVDANDPGSSILYVAAPVYSGKDIIAVLTVYKPQADVSHFISQRQENILSATILIGAGVILLTGAVFIWLFKPVGRLTNYAQSITRGERPATPNLGRGREVNTLGKALFDMREALEGRHYVENYVSSLTHELKSPLAAIKGAAELLHEDMPTEKRVKFIQNIRRETERSECLVRDLLQLAELERKAQLENKRRFDLSQLCYEVIHEAAAHMDEKNLTIDSHILANIKITGDAMILKLAINNILENAIGFSPEKGKITFSLSSAKGQAILTIRDQGPGIPEYAEQRAFEHFYSLPRPHSNYKGTGLGLPLVLEAAKLHGGKASIKNHTEGGCTASILLPIT